MQLRVAERNVIYAISKGWYGGLILNEIVHFFIWWNHTSPLYNHVNVVPINAMLREISSKLSCPPCWCFSKISPFWHFSNYQIHLSIACCSSRKSSVVIPRHQYIYQFFNHQMNMIILTVAKQQTTLITKHHLIYNW